MELSIEAIEELRGDINTLTSKVKELTERLNEHWHYGSAGPYMTYKAAFPQKDKPHRDILSW